MAYVLVTGGTGFIGSHTVVELIKAGKEVLIVDSLINSKKTVLDQIKLITGIKPRFVKADVSPARNGWRSRKATGEKR